MATQMHWAVSPVELSAGLRSSEASVRGSRLSLLGRSQRKKPTWGLFSVYTDPKSAAEENSRKSSAISSEQKIHEWVLEQAALAKKQKMKCNVTTMDVKPEVLNEAYERCRRVTAVYSKSFYWGTLLLTPEKRKAMWAIAVWCRRTDELVDGSFASYVTPSALDRWESRLEDLFAGRPYDMLDAALSDTVIKFPVVIQPFRDMIKGMRMDLNKSRYKNFDELYLYCYYVAGTVGFMCVPVMDIAPEAQATAESIYNAALAFGIANQLTNILRDVGEDARRGRIYLPQDELAQAGLSDVDVFNEKVTDKWRSFMRNQIKRARMFYHEAEKGLNTLRNTLSQDSRWAVYAASLLYQQILDEIEANDYDNFTKRACVSKANKLMMLPLAYQRACNQPIVRKLIELR